MAENDLGQATSNADTPKVPTKSIWIGGSVTGIIAGVAMAMVAMVASYMRGNEFWLMPKLIAATLLGPDSVEGGTGAIVGGLMIHMVTSAIFGIIFAFFTKRVFKARYDLGFGLLYGVVIWAVMTYVGLPIVNKLMSDQVEAMPTVWFVVHLVFGASLMLTPFFEKVSAPEEYRRAIPQRLAH